MIFTIRTSDERESTSSCEDDVASYNGDQMQQRVSTFENSDSWTTEWLALSFSRTRGSQTPTLAVAGLRKVNPC